MRVAGRDTMEGQGWLFRDPASGYCGVVTAAHVAAPGGTPGRVLITSARGLEGVGVDVRVLSPDKDTAGVGENAKDIAVMGVAGTILDKGCTTATLGSSRIGYMLTRSSMVWFMYRSNCRCRLLPFL